MKKILFTGSLLISLPAYSQELHPKLRALENLVGSIWAADGQWGDGSPFKQETTLEIGLSGNMLKSKTWAKRLVPNSTVVFSVSSTWVCTVIR